MCLYLLIGFVSALLSSVSGAGAALFATPLLLSVGVSLPAVLACNQLCASLWTPIASRNYKRDARLDVALIVCIGLAGVFGVWVGFKMAMLCSPQRLRLIIGWLILVVVGVSWCRPALSDASRAAQLPRATAIVLGFPLGAYQAFFGSGNTLFSSLMFCCTQGFDFRRALAHSYAVAFIWCASSAVLFWLEGFMQWDVAVPAAIGATLGATLGSKYGSLLSTEALRRVFLLTGAAMGFKLLLFS